MVLADGTFDPIHWGHVRYLSAAAALGELAVRVAPDADVLAKGRLLFQSRDERLKTIGSIRCVAYVIAREQSLADTVRELVPDYLVKGIDWKDRLPPDVIEACEDTGTQLLFLDVQERTSTERLRT
jgi:cytidyltransferase-like protein